MNPYDRRLPRRVRFARWWVEWWFAILSVLFVVAFVVVWFYALAVHEYKRHEAKVAECEAAGGVWLEQNNACLSRPQQR